jgi:dipeptide/tripeptide permease
MASPPGEPGGPEPSDRPEKAEQGILESTTINRDNLSRDSEKNDNDNENLRKVADPIPGSVWLVMLLTILEALAMAMAAIVQKLIYSSGPCYEFPLGCAASDGGTIPNSVSIFLQLPIFALEAFSEILSSPAGYELAFTMAPGSMKSVLQAVFSITGAVGSSLSIALSPLYKDPDMVWVYASLAIVMGIVTVVFYSIWGRKLRRTIVQK